jgi:hypothetical protein
MATRLDPDKHRSQVRAANRARYRAVQALISAHQIEFDTLYSEFAGNEGVTPKPRGRLDVISLQRQLADMERKLAELGASSPSSRSTA